MDEFAPRGHSDEHTGDVVVGHLRSDALVHDSELIGRGLDQLGGQGGAGLSDSAEKGVFRSADGGMITPAIRYLPADVPVGVWLRSSEIEVPPVAPPAE